ncbi:type I restriction endonuclease subunit R [Fructilactobacillus hinvesii]|uniref:Type I restriction enzyme endonuclease subunit n=1 Tax=Fructilactobacillus hinvesii TaxID=2940300 RepID=A0ABY5BUU2_9LACO|nr:type I restriction endonuclease subunit R [Fructilactobacillus hinvesii]USS88346.1 type I restriction endonuclease subunit R [Fructilactobacillus hinvesii]
MAEDQFEKAVIKKLEDEGWTYRPELSNKPDDILYQHWRDILNRNNRAKLDGTPLSDEEFNQLKLELEKNKTPCDAQLVIAGAGGIGTLPLTRDDGSQIEMEIFYGDEVAGGRSEYEVVNQITFKHLANTLSRERRIDVLLLINGLPVAHIEEKDESLQNQWNAFEQLKKYDDDGMYTGLMSFVQVQFILSQHSAHYFARPKSPSDYNQDFVFGWRDANGKDVTDTMEFIHQVMGIPALHRLVTVNMIPDAENGNLMVMRSYQIQATRAILERMKKMDNDQFIEREGGYVWHTTGSGKTVTSFKVAQLLASMPKVRNVLFIVDRVDLVDQTLNNFRSFAYQQFKNRIKKVKGHELKRALHLKNNGSHIYLITVQGLHRAVKRDLKSDERMVILMDEAHRSASGDAVKEIKAALPNTTWFGFTGTPNFYSDEIHDIKTSRDVSTHDIFGPRLHQYTIKDAIGDGNVLGFDVTYYETDIEKKEHPDYSDAELEKAAYTSTAYREAVVQDIVAHWHENADGPLEAGQRQPNQFHAMLAVSGKQAVVAYYHLFQKLAPELRVAMTFSRDETNGNGSSDLQAELKQAMKNYQKTFDTQDFLESKHPEQDYVSDITRRLAHKKPYDRKADEDRLDLVIVSDQLLTGFDSKYVNVIYMDKILKEGLLIQAMSRTNRVINKNAKPYGKVRFYRRGADMEDHVKNALVIYTLGGNDTIADAEKHASTKDDQALLNDDILASRYSQQIEKINPKLERLEEIAGSDFSQIPRSAKEQKEFSQLAAEVNGPVQQLMQQGYQLGTPAEVYNEKGEKTGKSVSLKLNSDNDFSSLQARWNDVNEKLAPEDRIDLTNLKLRLQQQNQEIIDYDRLVDLLNAYMDDQTEANRKAVENHITPLDEQSQTEISAIMDKIDDGDYQEHFDTESLKQARKAIRGELQELRIRRWADDQGYSGNQIMKLFAVYRPSTDLNDNPEFHQLIKQVEDEEKLGFFDRAQFEQAVQDFFASLH